MDGLNASLLMSDQMFATAMGIARFIQPVKSEGPVTVRRMAAYPSQARFSQDYTLGDPDADEGHAEAGDHHDHDAKEARLNWLLGYYFLVPSAPRRSGIDLLNRAAALARDPQFRRQRATLHEWQELVIEKGVSDAQAILDLDRHLKDYTEYMRDNLGDTRTRWAWTLAEGGTGAGAFFLPPLALPMALLPLVKQVVAKARKPVKVPYRSEVAAMVYTARRQLL